ncbi:hypothetical protein LTR84_002457 [Exophiala bonariae]|uniref:Uncharacterized protein n=1 Tax=Exophiala bonariae TaxID=1690606 RepID=A0AAV9NE75_9EURO|nr:hypothetical protein LTR84_002457 [Exophiala bonariae]
MAATQLQEEPEQELTISAEQLHYIQALNESPGCYARFFDALLIKKSSQADFFHDLKVFREQAVAINLLEPGTKEKFRKCTVVFLGSRFAHPWCRSSAAHASRWTKASWAGKTKKLTVEAQKEEDKLHRLLVPLWIAFRRRMFPEQDVLQKWVDEEPERQAAAAAAKAELEAKQEAQRSTKPARPHLDAAAPTVYPELGFATVATPLDASNCNPTPSSAQSTAVAQVFLGVAVTGFIMSDKRVKKYVEKKLKKDK